MTLTHQLLHSGGVCGRASIAKENWKPIDARKFGYDITAQPIRSFRVVLSRQEFLSFLARELCLILFQTALEMIDESKSV